MWWHIAYSRALAGLLLKSAYFLISMHDFEHFFVYRIFLDIATCFLATLAIFKIKSSRNSLRYSYIFLGLAFLALYFAPQFFGILYAFNVVLFWPYIYAWALSTQRHGRASALSSVIMKLVNIAVPLLSALLSSSRLYFIFLALLAFLPAFSEKVKPAPLGEIRFRKFFLFWLPLGFFNTLLELRERIIFLRTSASSAFQVGLYSSLILLFSALIELLVGEFTDRFGGRERALLASSLGTGVFFSLLLLGKNPLIVYPLLNIFYSNLLNLLLAYQADLGLKNYRDFLVRELMLRSGSVFGFLLLFPFLK